jgi:hypothetical protein
VVNVLVVLIQTDRLHHQVVDPQGAELAMEHEAKGASLVATMNLLGLRQLRLNPFQELGRTELLRGLRRRVLEDAHHDNRVGVHVQAQLDALIGFARDLLRADFGFSMIR